MPQTTHYVSDQKVCMYCGGIVRFMYKRNEETGETKQSCLVEEDPIKTADGKLQAVEHDCPESYEMETNR